ncbi:MAG: hypothetical protein JWO41_736 [Candidatus Saccharibacteria bacterium]|nr:hypothetical protein [Candidatus Saccharibacteria bacterium]
MKLASVRSRITACLSSEMFFRVIVGFMIFQALWIVFTAKYPMAFDEDFHFGIIKLYTHHLSPFWERHPADSDAFGAVTRDPSYLYHYLMSFILRFIRLFTQDQTIQVILLRLVNVGLFVGSLPIFRRLLLRSGASKAIVHSCLAVFILIPIVPLLAAQINYDNLLLPLVGLSLLVAERVASALRNQRKLELGQLLCLAVLCLATSVVKYAFLPIALAIVIYIGFGIIRAFGPGKRLRQETRQSFHRLKMLPRILLIFGLVLFGGLFIEREGLNTLRYHRPVPDCADVLTIEQCSAYGPWNRDYYLALNKSGDASDNPLTFTRSWFEGMWLRSYFTLAGPTEDYQTRGPLTVPSQSMIVFAVLGLALVPLYGRRVIKRYNAPLLELLTVVSVLYIGFLWVDEYLLYLHAGTAVAINGRYLLIIMLPVLLIVALCAREAFRLVPKLMPWAVVTILACGLWGGGVMTYMIRSSDNWYWPGSAPQALNHAAQKVLVPITPGSRTASQYLP